MRWLSSLGLVIAIAAGLLVQQRTPVRPPPSVFAEQAEASLKALAPGDTTVVVVDVDPASRPELEPFVHYAFEQALGRGAHVVTVSDTPYGAMLAQAWLDAALARTQTLYGRDAINLGFLEGHAAAPHVFGLPLARVTSRDHAGDVLADYAIAHELQKLDDAALTILVSSGGALEWVTQAQGRFASRLLVASTSQYAPELVPFFESGQLVGLVAGLRDVASLVPQDRQMATQRWTGLVLIALIVLGHALTLYAKRPKAAPQKPKAVAS